ncbi:MAG: RdgB/HAM1 family non-canonical purine NTP pyrophosphatase [Candidatus Sericytochromatia bacterium]|nr:RdgB/HAM1 family non-canonical purine NTP pyrophosphatase [Candidatus Tanganyikabacteria bacterium]
MSAQHVDVVLATTNAHKLEEFRRMLPERGVLRLGALDEAIEVEEDADTFAGNARKKALTVARLTGRVALADDSGLVIEALGGRPGIHSARYADTPEGRIARVLTELTGVEDRRAAFVCALCLAWPDGRMIETEGRVEGIMTYEQAGIGGFGYDPIFHSPELGCTLAEATPDAKDAVSHRGRALAALLERLA